MPRYFPDELLRRLRNDISWATLLEQLGWPHKQRQGQLAFLCPRCHEYLSAVNPRTNLGRCFYCLHFRRTQAFIREIGLGMKAVLGVGDLTFSQNHPDCVF